MPETTILGYVSIVPKGAYNPTTTYNRLNVVSYNGGSFMLIVDTPTSGVTPVDGATWLQLCAAGEDATVTAQDVAYAASDQGETPPDTGWQTTVPTVPGGGYLWTRIETTYSDGSSYDTFMVTRFGVDGSGSVSSVNGISPDGTGNVTLTIGSIAQVDSVPTFNSTHLVTSGGVYSRINAVLSSTQVKIQNDVVSLPAASWTGSGPYTQTVAVAGTTAQSQINVAGSPAQIAAAQNGGYNIQFVNASGTITAYAIGAKPSTDLSVFVTITELSGATGTIYGASLVGSPVFPSGMLKGNGSGVVSAVSTIPVASGGTGATTAAAARANLGALSSADGAVETAKIKDKAVTAPKIADGAVTRAKLAQDALVSPLKFFSGNSYTIAAEDIGRTIMPTSGDNNEKTVNLTYDVSHSLPIGTVIAVARPEANVTKISFGENVRVGIPGNNTWLTAPTVSISNRFSTVALTLKDLGAQDYWFLAGDVEVVT